MDKKQLLEKLNQSFGSYRAEWLKTQIFELFAEPQYFPALQDNRPCVLEGGRGTGKTTALRGLSYQGQYAIHNENIEAFDKGNFIGIYHRVNTNHVRAFIGESLSEQKWEKVFAHYFNLLICKDILVFIRWHKPLSNNDEDLSPHACKLIASSVQNENQSCENLEQLIEVFEIQMISFQSQINNIIDEGLPFLSMAGDPIKLITENTILLNQFKDKIFFILLDEYENYENYQQKILNTLIKHSSENYTFKIGVRELGWRIKHTLNESELLSDPADYVLVNIEQKLTEQEATFPDFARKVCQQRIGKLLQNQEDSNNFDIQMSLKGVTIEEEAILLEVQKTKYIQNYELIPKSYQKKVKTLSPLYKFFISYWATTHNSTLTKTIDEYELKKDEWNVRYENYKYEMLFKIRTGRGKAGIQKYYSGWTTYTKLANGNIRYLMELVYRAYEKHFNSDETLSTPISPKNQTVAAQDAGLKNLMELEGLWKKGAQITKLLLGMGRVFQLLARSVSKTAPEQNQFSIDHMNPISEELEELLRASVMHLALVRTPGNKMGDKTNTRDYIYMIHPLFSAYFQFSYRKKRKINIRSEDILGLIENQKITIDNILKKSNLFFDTDNHLPQQMNLFEEYYYEK